MKRWALVVAGLYLLALVVLTVPVVYAAFGWPNRGNDTMPLWDAAGVFSVWPYWAWLGILVLSQIALLAVPVKVAQRRPVARRPLIVTVLASGLMMGGLALGFGLALAEAICRDDGPGWGLTATLVLGGMTWVCWAILFYRLGRRREPRDIVTRQCRYLFRGSVLELLVAVPLHVIARHRDYCCAGYLTFVGIAMGAAVMLFSFGPSVYFLFAARWARLHPTTAGNPPDQSAAPGGGKL